MNSFKNQQILPLQLREAKNREDFVVGESNKNAVSWIDKYPKWNNDGLIIVGPKSSGKSHLVSVWQEKSNCDIFECSDLDEENKNLLYANNIVIENIDRVKNHKYLLHVFNLKKEKKFKMLFTSSLNPGDMKINLQDIKSRLISLPQAYILLPSDDVLKGLLYKLFKDKGILLNSNIINYIYVRIERTYLSVNDLVGDVDRFSLLKKKKITIPLIKEILKSK